jgi:hypothetical protein
LSDRCNLFGITKPGKLVPGHSDSFCSDGDYHPERNYIDRRNRQ